MKKIPSFIVLLLLIIAGVGLALIPPATGVDPRAYPVLGIFVSMVLGVILAPYPPATVALLGLFAFMVSRLVTVEEGLRCFSEPVMWLVIFASVAAQSLTKTSLGQRIACFFIEKTGRSSLSLAYGVIMSEIVFSPMIPSNTARAACISVPLAVSISESLGSHPSDGTGDRIGRFLTLCTLHANQMVSALFLTAMGTNPLIQKFMANIGITIGWGEWALMACVPGILCLLVIPLMMIRLAPPQFTTIPQAKTLAKKQRAALPPLGKKEIVTIVVFIAMLVFWIFGDRLGVSTVFVAFGALCALLAAEVLKIEDLTGAKNIWGVALWLTIFIFATGKLTEFGLIQHYAGLLREGLVGASWGAVLIVVSLLYYIAHYVLPGNTLHACALFPAFAQILVAFGVPAKMGCMVLAFLTAFCGFITPFSTSSCPIIYGTGYIGQKLWWKIGLIASVVDLLIWGTVGGAWWKVLGYW